MPRPTLRTIDLFAGAGGLSLGFEQAGLGYRSIFAVEHDASAAASFRANLNGEVAVEPIENVCDFPDAEIVLGGPPCQGFSPLGRNGSASSRTALNGLWTEFLRVVKQVRPIAFVMENVPQFLNSDQFAAYESHCRRSPHLRDYQLVRGTLNAADYGVPQNRRRGFVVGVLSVAAQWPPPATYGDPPLPPKMTVGDAFCGLGPAMDDGPDEWHAPRNPTELSRRRYRLIGPGGNRFDLEETAEGRALLPDCWRNKRSGTTDVFGRMEWHKQAPTIRTEFFKPEKGRYLHPEEHRAITHREAARLQTFPDSFRFCGSKTEVARQIGNAVPPSLAEGLARHLYPTIIEAIRIRGQLDRMGSSA